MELTSAERERIRAAHDRAAAEEEVADAWTPLALARSKNESAAAEKLAKVWHGMTEDDRAAIRGELALICGADPHELDVGLAAQRVILGARGKPGVQVRARGFNAAVAEAAIVWVDRGNRRELGNLWRDSKPGEPYPMLTFVTMAVEAVLPAEAIARATGMKSPDRAKLLQSVDARLRA